MAVDFFSLQRPQYVATPEVLLSALAWRAAPDEPTDLSGKAVVYRVLGKGKSRDLQTSPMTAGAKDRLTNLRQHIKQTCGVSDSDLDFATSVVIEQLQSQVREKARSVGVLPLSLTAALMQNARGVLGVDHPPNFAAMLQRMFELGGTSRSETAASLLIELFRANTETDAAIGWFASCIDAMAPTELVGLATDLVAPTGATSRPAWLQGAGTPYKWFHDAWASLCTGDWFTSMPRRRWVDWATCVLRTAIGAGFLYEVSFYHRLVLSLTDDKCAADVANTILRPDPDLLRWDPRQPVSKQDIAGAIKRLSNIGLACRTFLLDCENVDGFPSMDEYVDAVDGLEQWIIAARSRMDHDLRSLRKEALTFANTGTGKNMRETISGSLVARSGAVGWVDSYSLLRRRGRYLLVDPGQEWLSVIASLGARRAGGTSRVATLLTDLGAIGLRPTYNTIIEHLEAAGLARSSHDSDDAVEIAAAF